MYKSGRSASCGFTLVELLLVLIIASVLAAVAIPRLVDRGAFQTHGAAAEVSTALRYAQRLAMAKNREVCVAATTANLTLTLNPTSVSAAPCSEPALRPGDGSPYVVTLPAGIGLAPATAFRFDPQGRPLPNAAVSLMLGGSAPVTVERETGYVR